ncbi:MAG: hypothetical protein GDA41_02445 [Rhodospirillales bacterium]|nr:hypothetical protein [Rhodospirillales bacterium]
MFANRQGQLQQVLRRPGQQFQFHLRDEHLLVAGPDAALVEGHLDPALRQTYRKDLVDDLGDEELLQRLWASV